MTERLDFHFSFSCIGEGNGNPLQYSCPENPRTPTDGGVCWAAVYGVTQSRTRLKRLSSSSRSSSKFIKSMRIENYIKWHHKETVNQILKVGIVTGQMIHFLQQVSALKKLGGGSNSVD